MSKHSIVSVGLGLGLMAASLGASAQALHTFDYSSVYFGSAVGGNKYVSFVPTMDRGAATKGAAGVLMLEFYQPNSGTASTWAFALGGPVDKAAGGSGADAIGVYTDVAMTVHNGLALSRNYFFGDVVSISHAFNQEVVVSSQACNVTFAALIGSNDQLAFGSVSAAPVGWVTANGIVSVQTGVVATQSFIIASDVWNNASATLVSNYALNSSLGLTVPAAASTVYASAAVNAMLAARNKCVPAYTARASGGGTTIIGDPVGMVRIY